MVTLLLPHVCYETNFLFVKQVVGNMIAKTLAPIELWHLRPNSRSRKTKQNID